MNVVSTPFPLFNLPSNVIIDILRNMECFQQIGFSILSEKAKEIVKSLNLKSSGLHVTMDDTIDLKFSFKEKNSSITMYFYSEGNDERYALKIVDPPMKLEECGVCHVVCMTSVEHELQEGEEYVEEEIFEEKQEWAKNGFKLRDWIDHFNSILHESQIDDLEFRGRIDNFEIDSLQNTIKGLNIGRILLNLHGFFNYSEMIITTVRSFEMLTLIGEPIDTVQKVLMANFNSLGFLTTRQLTLDDLLICNSLNLAIYFDSELTEKELNRFLKHWINGSNPRMNSLLIQKQGLLDHNAILSGITYEVVPDSQKRIRKHRKIGLYDTGITIYRGGFDIWRNDGTLANIQFKCDELEGTTVFELIVWHDFLNFDQVDC